MPVPERATAILELLASLVMVREPFAELALCGAKITLNDWRVPAASVNGRLKPLTVNPGPVIPAWVMVTLDPPVLLTVSCIVLLEEVCTAPKLRLELLSVSVPGVVALPDNGTVKDPLEAVLVMVRTELALPPPAGLNATLKDRLWPASRVAGSVTPLTLKPVPEAEIWLMVTELPPELVRLSERLLLSPKSIEPKLRLDGVAVNAPSVTPEPESDQESAAPALGVSVTDPVALPADRGANVTVKVALWPAARLKGAVIPLSVNPLPVTAAWLMVTLDPPLLVTVADCF